MGALAGVKGLEAAKAGHRFARAHAAAPGKAVSRKYVSNVSKGYFDIWQAERKADADARFAEIKADVDARFAGVRPELLLLKWMIGFNVVLSAEFLLKLLS